MLKLPIASLFPSTILMENAAFLEVRPIVLPSRRRVVGVVFQIILASGAEAWLVVCQTQELGAFQGFYKTVEQVCQMINVPPADFRHEFANPDGELVPVE